MLIAPTQIMGSVSLLAQVAGIVPVGGCMGPNGRPLGLMLSWLNQSAIHSDKGEHWRWDAFDSPLHIRLEARAAMLETGARAAEARAPEG